MQPSNSDLEALTTQWATLGIDDQSIVDLCWVGGA